MDLQQIETKLNAISDEWFAGSEVTANKLLHQLLDEVKKARLDQTSMAEQALYYPEWRKEDGIIWGEMVHDHTFDEGTIHISIVRTHQYNINGCVFRIEGTGPIQNDMMYEEFQEHCDQAFSWTNGSGVPDSYFIIALLGTKPQPQVLRAFMNGMITIEGLDDNKVQEIFGNWERFIQQNPLHDFGSIQEDESSDT